ncbi:MAG: ATPase [Sphingomonadales bacterium]|nr:ATPase [Sphingomonadales bacterium]
MSQIALPLEPRAGGGARRIVVGSANAAAIEAFAGAAAWPFRTAILFGPPRSGKSLLAEYFAASGLGEVLDDADRLEEVAVFHRWNRAQHDQRPLLLTASVRGAVAGGWQVALPDLASRLAAALRLEIGAPDDAMAEELIAAHAAARGLAIGSEGARYLALRAERSHVGLERLVATIDRLSLERKTAPGLAIWRDALDALSGRGQPRLL